MHIQWSKYENFRDIYFYKFASLVRFMGWMYLISTIDLSWIGFQRHRNVPTLMALKL